MNMGGKGMLVSCWKGGTYGIRITKDDRNRFFQRQWTTVTVTAGSNTSTHKIEGTFWTTCPELRGGAIKDYVLAQGHSSWKTGNPPKLTLTPNHGNSFTLT